MAIVATMCGSLRKSLAADELDRQPINYSSPAADDAIAKLRQRIDRGEVALQFEQPHGYLRSVLRLLKVTSSSQTLVFSKTSLQLRRISRWSPRAIYFNDDVYVAWVPGGDVLELSAVDPQKGGVFYTLRQTESSRANFVRDRGNCLSCHASPRTRRVPGHLVRSLYVSATGQPFFGAGTYRTNHSSPWKRRWGGWFVTGTHGRHRHLGNLFVTNADATEDLDLEAGANVTDLSKLTDTTRYLTPHSDLVALMVLAHQADMHNLITLANYSTRRALYDIAMINRALKRDPQAISDSTRRRVNSAAEKLLKYMLFVKETRLTARIRGTSDFAKRFRSLGPRDSRGRSLRDFDLRRRMFRYPCSYLIYSRAFQALAPMVKQRTLARLWEILTGRDQSKTFSHLSSRDRQAIREILAETMPDLPSYWKIRS